MKAWLKRLYLRLPVIRELEDIRWQVAAATAAEINLFRQILLAQPKYQDPRRLNRFEIQSFSQNMEDGIIAEIFQRIGVRSRVCVETGAGEGLENNTVALLLQGWTTHWLEADDKACRRIHARFGEFLGAGKLKLAQALVTAENVEQLLVELAVPSEFDLLSLDVDRNTYHVWKAIERFRPRVVVVEYNASFPPTVEWEVPYAPAKAWNYTLHFGASLKSYERLAEAKGYHLVGCDLTGTNAFFVRAEECLDRFASPFTAENHYEPPRYWASRREGHARGISD
jgi:hypothetical protein